MECAIASDRDQSLNVVLFEDLCRGCLAFERSEFFTTAAA